MNCVMDRSVLVLFLISISPTIDITGAALAPFVQHAHPSMGVHAMWLTPLPIFLQGQFTPEMAVKTLGLRPISNLRCQQSRPVEGCGKWEESQKADTLAEPELSMMDSELASAGEFPSDITFR